MENLIKNLSTTFKNHRIENCGDINFIFFNFDNKNLCLKYTNDFKIETLICQDNDGSYQEELKANYVKGEYINCENNSLLPTDFCQEKLSLQDFLNLIN